jgi:Mn-dependent DtxR family transcriptional regulator
MNATKAVKRKKLKKKLYKECKSIANTENIPDLFVETLSSNGVVGEEQTLKLLYLCLTTRFLEQPVSAVVKAESSAGKSHIVKTLLVFFPKSAYHVLTSMSDKALVYSEKSFKHRFLIIHEIQGVSKEALDYLIRVLLTEGKIEYEVTGKGTFTKKGPTGLITTTTKTQLNPENETRYLSLSIDESKEQTKRIISEQADQAATGKKILRDMTEDAEPWIAFQKWLRLAKHKVKIPYAPAISELIEPESIRLRRDFEKLLDLVKAHAIIHQKTRKIDDEGCIIAKIKDYAKVAWPLNDVLSTSSDVKVPKKIVEMVNAVKEIMDNDDENKKSVSITDIAKHLGVNKSTIQKRIGEALEKGFLVSPRIVGGRAAQIRLGDPIPNDNRILPTPKNVKDMYRKLKGK